MMKIAFLNIEKDVRNGEYPKKKQQQSIELNVYLFLIMNGTILTVK